MKEEVAFPLLARMQHHGKEMVERVSRLLYSLDIMYVLFVQYTTYEYIMMLYYYHLVFTYLLNTYRES